MFRICSVCILYELCYNNACKLIQVPFDHIRKVFYSACIFSLTKPRGDPVEVSLRDLV